MVPPAAHGPELERRFVDPKKILFLQKRLLFPTDSGGKIRTLNVLRHLATWHDITYLSNILADEEPYLAKMEALGLQMVTIPWTEAPRRSPQFYRDLAFNVLSPYPFNVSKDFDRRLRQRARTLLQEQDFDLLVCDFVQMARNCLGFTSVPKVLFEHNVEAQIFQRHAQQDPGALRRAYMWMQWRKMLRFERRAGADFDAVIAVSDQDRDFYETRYDWHHAHAIDTAVDTDYFAPRSNVETDRRCVFIGSMDWLPNEDGVRYFVREVWPLVRSRYPDATFQIVGRHPSAAVLGLHGRDGVEVTGNVPDVRPFLADAQVTVIPLLVGGGTRLKVFEAMAMAKPIVSTSLGVEGLQVVHGATAMLADTTTDFAEELLRLFDSPSLRKRIADDALRMVRAHYSTEIVARQFDAICRATIESHEQ